MREKGRVEGSQTQFLGPPPLQPFSLYFHSTSSRALTRYSLGGRASSGMNSNGPSEPRACTSHFSSASLGKFKACRWRNRGWPPVLAPRRLPRSVSCSMAPTLGLPWQLNWHVYTRSRATLIVIASNSHWAVVGPKGKMRRDVGTQRMWPPRLSHLQSRENSPFPPLVSLLPS